MNDFFAMGGYAAYVWPSYAIAVAALVGMLVISRRSLKRREAALAALEQVRPRRRRPAPTAPAVEPAAPLEAQP